MYNNYIPSDNFTPQVRYSAQGALEIAVRVRKQEKNLALMNEVSNLEMSGQKKARSNPIRSLIVSIFSLAR